MKFSKKDLKFSIITGLITGTIVWRILEFLHVPPLVKGYGELELLCPFLPPCVNQYVHYIYIYWSWLVLIVPVVWIIGVNLGYFLGRWLNFFNQFGRYAAVGFTNAAVDFGVLNLLIALSGYNNGWHYTFFKTCSFVVAVLLSYVWNRFWVFGTGDSSKHGAEFAKFISVNIVAALINIAVASLVVNFIHPIGNIDANTWANLGAVAGSAVALIFNFVGFKLAVFKK